MPQTTVFESPQYLKNALQQLKIILPNSTWVEIHGVDHAATWNPERGGNPIHVANAVKKYLLGK
ncbi:hypothetical protein [Pseudarcicella hirudinis]|uniref:hypothetical protein n=1 Tax=Pseudarcicella hirudinis TaxID=1079859 RepID=UPI000B893EBD|nr:hypothetical protein [Pseudarcicella hirudinis]